MRRRLDLAASLVATPPVLFLDEPTTGLDPHSRNELWAVLRELVGDGTTLLLTTQYLEEADRLADRIAVIDGGRVIARGTPAELKARVGGERVVVTLRGAGELDAAAAAIAPLAAEHPHGDAGTLEVTAPVSPARRCSGSSARSTRRTWPSPTSRCAAPRSTTPSSPSPATRPRSRPTGGRRMSALADTPPLARDPDPLGAGRLPRAHAGATSATSGTCPRS